MTKVTEMKNDCSPLQAFGHQLGVELTKQAGVILSLLGPWAAHCRLVFHQTCFVGRPMKHQDFSSTAVTTAQSPIEEVLQPMYVAVTMYVVIQWTLPLGYGRGIWYNRCGGVSSDSFNRTRPTKHQDDFSLLDGRPN